MSDILKLVFGLVVDKARSATADFLSDGDLTDEKLREKVISDIDDIKSSLRGLSRQPLNSSFHFLKEGISRMGMAFRNKYTTKQSEQATITHAAEEFVAGAVAPTSQRAKQRSVGVDLSSADIEIVSQERWADAKKSFRKSREQATIAFGNTALSVEDKIMACKLRIASSILEKFLDDPEAAAQDCLLYLQELHDLPAVRETFTVHIKGGLRSRFNKIKRSEMVESVKAINNVLSDFMLKFTLKMVLYRYVKWPAIQLTGSELLREHIFVDVQKMRKKGLKSNEMNNENLLKRRWPSFKFSHEYTSTGCRPEAVNSDGRIYWLPDWRRVSMTVIS